MSGRIEREEPHLGTVKEGTSGGLLGPEPLTHDELVLYKGHARTHNGLEQKEAYRPSSSGLIAYDRQDLASVDQREEWVGKFKVACKTGDEKKI